MYVKFGLVISTFKNGGKRVYFFLLPGSLPTTAAAKEA
jgi:hypothetical protein